VKLEKALKLQEEAHKRKMKIRGKKGHDYAHPDEDCLANFKVMADIAFVCKDRGYEIDITKAWGVAMWHLLHKIVRLLKLYNSGVEPQNESTVDTHDDLENYSELMKECYIDEST